MVSLQAANKSTTSVSSKHIKFLVAFDNKILEKWKKQTKDPAKKEIFTQAQQRFKESREIDKDTEKLIRETIGPIPAKAANNFHKIHAIVLQRLNASDPQGTTDTHSTRC